MSDKVMVYAVWDVKSKVFDIPFFARNDYMAARRFIMDVKADDQRNVMGRFKEDFELWKLGEYSQSSGEFENKSVVIHKGTEVE